MLLLAWCSNMLCIAVYLCRVNLYELIKKNNFQGFSLALIRRFAHALLRCLQMLHREKIIHCDLKPVLTPAASVTPYHANYWAGLNIQTSQQNLTWATHLH